MKKILPKPLKIETTSTKSKIKLENSNVVITNYPESCPVCHLHQCEMDLRHDIYFTVFKTLQETFAKFDEKPPDENLTDNFPPA